MLFKISALYTTHAVLQPYYCHYINLQSSSFNPIRPGGGGGVGGGAESARSDFER